MQLLAANTVRDVVRTRNLRNVDEWLRDQLNYGASAPTAVVYEEYEHLGASPNGYDQAIRDQLALYLFAHAAENCTSDGKPPANRTQPWERPDHWLQQPAFLRLLYDFYQVFPSPSLHNSHWPPISVNDRTRWKARGLTSFILVVNETYVLKLLKPWYRQNPTIIAGTNVYANTLKALQLSAMNFAPAIHHHGDSWILMDHIDGLTLRQHWEHNLVGVETIERMTRTRDLARAISEALNACSQIVSHHGDLSPFNIIVTGVHPRTTVMLIDFGQNYLVDQNVGSYQAFLDHGVYIAPESFVQPQPTALFYASMPANVVRDVYSFAVTLVELLADETLSPVAGHRTPYETLSKLRSKSEHWGMESVFDVLAMLVIGDPWLRAAAVLTDAVPHQPETLKEGVRARLFSQASVSRTPVVLPSEHYSGIRDKLETEFTAGVERVSGANGWLTLSNFVRAPFAGTLDTLVLRKPPKDKGDLAAFLGVALASGTVSCAFIVSKLISGPFLSGCSTTCIQLFGLPPFTVNLDVLYWFVGLSLVFMAFLYYANIFCEVDRHYVSTGTRTCLGLVTILPIAIGPILAANPSWWPTVGFLGLLLVAANNHLFYKVVHAARHALMRGGEPLGDRQGIALPVTGDMDASLAIFSSWQITSSLYGVFLGVIALLAAVGLIGDLWLFALVVLVTNAEGIRRSMVRQAPGMRRMLMQFTSWQQRITKSQANWAKLREFESDLQEKEYHGKHFTLSASPGTGQYRLTTSEIDFDYVQAELRTFLATKDVEQSWLPLTVDLCPYAALHKGRSNGRRLYRGAPRMLGGHAGRA